MKISLLQMNSVADIDANIRQMTDLGDKATAMHKALSKVARDWIEEEDFWMAYAHGPEELNMLLVPRAGQFRNFAPVEAIQRIQLGPRSALVALFIIAIYGGYFGGGIGFLMLAAFTLFGMRDINAMNGLKMALVGIMTITAILTFVVANVVRWPEALPMLAGSAVGSYMAAHWAQRPQALTNGAVTRSPTRQRRTPGRIDFNWHLIGCAADAL